MTVYVLRMERVFNGCNDYEKIEVYATKDLALKRFTKIVDDEREDWEEDECFIDEYDAEFYCEGEYEENHFSVYIQEKEVIAK